MGERICTCIVVTERLPTKWWCPQQLHAVQWCVLYFTRVLPSSSKSLPQHCRPHWPCRSIPQMPGPRYCLQSTVIRAAANPAEKNEYHTCSRLRPHAAKLAEALEYIEAEGELRT